MPWIIYAALLGGILYMAWRFSGARSSQTSLLSFGKSRGRLLGSGESNTTFDDVAGADEAKEELTEVIDFLASPDRYLKLGARIPRGVLLVGPPGTGKTLLARAVAGEAGVPFISISGSEFNEMLVGVGAARVRDLFRQAADVAPSIMFIDELDALGRARSSIVQSSSDEQTLNQLLVEMDGFTARETVVVMAATNRPEILDAALLRPGRFDRQIVVDVPDRKGREEILAVHAKKVPLGADVDLPMLAKRTPGLAGADLANLVNEAALLSARRDADEVDMEAFSEAIERVVAGLKKKNRLLDDEEKRRVAYHEVGHALAAVLAGVDEKVHKISIVPRGRAALGYTLQLPDDERYLITEPSLRARIVGLLGGRAAEEVVYGNPSTGAQNDLQRATELARAMVVDFGMSPEVGPISISRNRSAFLSREGDPTATQEIGDDLADAIDREVRRLVAEGLSTARTLLEENRDHLDSITIRLFEVETLEGDELDELLGDAQNTHKARRH